MVKDDGLAAGKGVLVTDDLRRGPRPRRGLRPGGDRGVPGRAGGQPVRHHRRPDRTRAAARPGLQAGRRRRLRPQHRRHGRVHPAALGAARPGRRGHRDRAAADRGRAGPAGHALRRAALRRAGADRPRRAGDRVQRPVRRPGDPAAAGPADHAAGRGAVRRGDRQPGRPAGAGVDRRCRRRRGAGRRELSRTAGDRRGDHGLEQAGDGRCGGGARRHRLDADGRLVSSGGRVLCVVGTGRRRRPGPGAGVPGISKISWPARSTAPTSPPGCRRPREAGA